MRGRSLRAFLFDLDGVLVDSTNIVKRGWEIFAAQRGITIPEADYPRAIHGRRTREILVDYFGLGSAEASSLIAASFDDKTSLVGDGELVEIPGAVAFVHASKKLGLLLAVASSASAPNVALALRDLGLTAAFDAVVSAADVSHGKPAPDPYICAAARLGIDPQDSVVFEDTIFGIASAKAAGARCVAIATTLRREDLLTADLVIDDFRDLEPAQVLKDLAG